MAPTPKESKLLVIVGPTASGKSELAMKIARKFNGEIIAADSRTIYKGMDIGAAKPTSRDQKQIPHWGLDLIEPGKPFSVARYKSYAESKIDDIQRRGKLPIIVGGTGLYVDSLLFNFTFTNTKPNKLRRFIYSTWSIEKLQKVIAQRDWPMPENSLNKRHLVGVLERRGKTGKKDNDLLSGTVLIGIMPSNHILKQRISARVEQIFERGVILETKKLLKKYGLRKVEQSGGIAYKFTVDIVEGKLNQVEAKDLIQKNEWQYARRQKTWFKRNKFIQWYANTDEAFTTVIELLNK